VLFDAIERSLKNTPASDLISNLYKGVTVNQIVCTNCKNVSEREEAFQDVTLTVAGLGSVTASLAAATEYEMLTGDNRYRITPACDVRLGFACADVSPRPLSRQLQLRELWAEGGRTQGRRVSISASHPYPLALAVHL
jgi:hypothetical protein